VSVSQIAVALGVVVVAGLVAWLLRRRTQTDAPSQPRNHSVPAQLDRHDFPRPDAPWLVAVFTSATCNSCADVRTKAAVLACDDVVVHEAEYTAAKELHRRYSIEAVPATLIVDRAGVVQASFLGPVSATDLWAAVAEARQPGTSPEPDLGR
jgi:hypothetical protein